MNVFSFEFCRPHTLSEIICPDMAKTNIDLDDRLVKEGLRIFKCRSKRELVHLALSELLRDAKRKEILKLRGQVKWEADLDEIRHSRLIKRYSGKAPRGFSHS